MVALLGLSAGCQKNPATGSVTGVVTYKGEPLANADVRFIPDPLGPRGSIAKTDSEGRYELMYEAGVPGAIPGKYKVVISTVGSGAGPAPAEDAPEAAADDPYASTPDNSPMASMMGGGAEILPMKYCSSKETILTAEVTEGENTCNFDLEE